MTQADLFDPAEAEARKIEGMTQAAQKKPNTLAVARDFAVKLGEIDARVIHTPESRGGITIDTVYAELERLGTGIGPEQLGNAAGKVFVGKRWRCVGIEKSRRAARRSGMLRVWRLAREDETGC